MTENPFTYGNPITKPERFIGRHREIEQVFSRLLNAEGESTSIVGERRIGKTSLLHTIMHPDVRRLHGVDDGRYIFVYSDLQMIDPKTTATRLAQRLFGQLARQTSDEEIRGMVDEMRQSAEIDNFALSDLFDTIDSKGLHVVFLLDEFENVTGNPNFGADFFYGLRSLAIQHNLTLITSSRSELIELTHSEEIRSSPFFNIFANINVRLFTPDEAKELVERALSGTGVLFSSDETSAVDRMAGRHPFFRQMACYHLFSAYQQGLDPAGRLAFMHKQYVEESTPHLASFWWDASDSDKIVLTTLALLEHNGKVSQRSFNLARLRELYNRSEQTLNQLEKRALLVQSNGDYSLFCTALGDWIIAEITDTMRDEQSYDDWLKSNQGAMERLSRDARTQLTDILPKISAKYRDLMIDWVSDPKNLIAVAALIRGALSAVGSI